jgi:hypothetical protein
MTAPADVNTDAQTLPRFQRDSHHADNLSLVYALSSDGADNYSRMAHLSIVCARRIHPQAKVTLVCDEVTAAALPGRADALTACVDQVRMVQTGMPTAVERSRFVKTSLRQVVPGDFIFLDVDALPVRPFRQMIDRVRDIGAVPDCGPQTTDRLSFKAAARVYFSRPQLPQRVQTVFAQMGWDFPPRHYLNSGVMVFRDTPGAHRVGGLWHQRWLQCRAQGVMQDQFALARALDEAGTHVVELPRRFNGMIGTFPWYANRAAIFHFFTHGKGQPAEGTVLAEMIERYESTGTCDEGLIDRLLQSKYPWRTRTVRKLIASGVYHDALCHAWHKLVGANQRRNGSV